MSARPPEQSASEITYWRILQSQDPASLCRRTLATWDAEREAYLLRLADLAYAITPKTRTIAPGEDVASSGVDWALGSSH